MKINAVKGTGNYYCHEKSQFQNSVASIKCLENDGHMFSEVKRMKVHSFLLAIKKDDGSVSRN